MDVELQIIKHLARDAQSTAPVVDEYCAEYKDLFKEVRSYECFKYLHLGIISSIKRKSLPEIAKTVGMISAQSLHHFMANSPWSVKELEEKRLRRILKELNRQSITVVIDETGDRKKGKKTDYVARQYLGSLGKIDNGIVSVNAYGVYKNITFPLKVKVFKPKNTLKAADKYQTKIELAREIIDELIEFGLSIKLVLSDSLYGESSEFIRTLEKHHLDYIVAIRSNHAVWMPSEQTVRANKWCEFERIFSNKKTEPRYIREIIYGKKGRRTYWEITTDPETMPENSTSFVMTNIQGKVKQVLGNLYGLRTWVEYGFRQCKQELGWTDYRFTNFKDIEKWWEIIFSVYTMVSLNSPAFISLNQQIETDEVDRKNQGVDFSGHREWDGGMGWKNTLNNLRLVFQPILLFWLILPWLDIFPNSQLLLGFNHLIHSIYQYQPFYSSA
jgi:SRSO17 transposase